MSDLPKGWVQATLGDIGQYINGRGFKRSEWRDSGRPIIRIQNLTGTSTEYNYFQGEAEDRHTARCGDLLISWAATLGVFEWKGPEAVINQHIFKVESYIDKNFHRFLVEHVLEDLRSHAHGSGMVHVTKSTFDDTRIPVPPLAEQRRIVDAIENHFSRIDAATLSVRQARWRFDQLQASLLNSISDAPATTLGSLTLSAGYGTSVKCSYEGDGITVVRIPNIRDRELDLTDLKYATGPVNDSAMLDDGDILFVRTNGSRDLIGRVAVVPSTALPLAFASYLIRVQVDRRRAHPEYLALALSAPSTRHYLMASAESSAGQLNLNLAKIAAIEVPLPDLESQLEIVDRTKNAMTYLNRAESQVCAVEQEAELLKRSTLAQAIAGNLVHQDPDDEPASDHLKRIRAEKNISLDANTRRKKVTA